MADPATSASASGRLILVVGAYEAHEVTLTAAGAGRYAWQPVEDLHEATGDFAAILIIASGRTPRIAELGEWAHRRQLPLIVWSPYQSEVDPRVHQVAREVIREGAAQDVVRTLDRILSRNAAAAARVGSVVVGEGQLRGALLGYPKGLVLLDEQERILLANSLALRLLRISDTPQEGDFLPFTLAELSRGVRFEDGQVLSVRTRPFSWNQRSATWLELSAAESGEDDANERAHRLHVDRLVAVGQMAAGMAHEVNNPVSYIIANTNTFSDHIDRLETALRRLRQVVAADVQIAGAFDRVMDRLGVQDTLRDMREISRENLEGAGRITAIVRDLKNFSRIEPDQVEVVTVNQIVNEACMLVNNQIRYKAQLVKRLGEVPRIPVARQKLNQVVTNLLINAAQAIPEGDGSHHRIQVQTWAESDRVVISVTDTGCGIPEHLTKRIFEPFVSTKVKEGGTGLGLSLCVDIVRQHGGQIRLYSAVGQGSQFDVVLPLQTGLVPAKDKSDQSPAQKVDGSRARILFIDDEVMLLRAIRRLLGPHHEVVTVGGGVEALELLEGDRSFDVVICDLMMPQVDGPMLHEEIRRRWPDVESRMVFCSGGAFSPRVRSFAEREQERCIEKPVTLQQLTTTIDRIRRRAEA